MRKKLNEGGLAWQEIDSILLHLFNKHVMKISHSLKGNHLDQKLLKRCFPLQTWRQKLLKLQAGFMCQDWRGDGSLCADFQSSFYTFSHTHHSWKGRQNGCFQWWPTLPASALPQHIYLQPSFLNETQGGLHSMWLVPLQHVSQCTGSPLILVCFWF